MIVATSDVHLGYYCSGEDLFREFVADMAKNEEVEHLVLAGDIFDMWRRDPLKLLVEYNDILEQFKDMQTEGKKVHFLAGNHDYHMIELKNEMKNRFNLSVCMNVLLPCGDKRYYFIHGHQFEYVDNVDLYQKFSNALCMGDDKAGATADSLWELYKTLFSPFERLQHRLKTNLKKTLKLPTKRLTEKDIDAIEEQAIKMREESKDQIADCYIVYGHTHRGCVNEDQNLANTGSWVDDPSRPLLKKNTYLTLKDGSITIEEYSP